jgi:hypothetical protein
MKKNTLIIALFSFLFFIQNQSSAQLVQDVANWPNTAWTITGAYTNSGFVKDPRVDANFSFDDDLAGSASLNDVINAESPVIDLSPAFSGGEQQIQISFDYVYRRTGDVLSIEWWDGTTWQQLEILNGNSNNQDYKSCSSMQSFVSQPLTISTFTASQLIGFKYRIKYNGSGFYWGFCMGSPTLESIATPPCFEVSSITIDPANITYNSAEIDWVDSNSPTPANGWEIEYGPAGFTQGSGTTVTTTIHPYTLTGLTDDTTYDVYIRTMCNATEQSSWVGPISFTTPTIPVGCGGQFVDSGGVNGNYSNSEDIITTLCPDNTGDVVTLQFLEFNVENNYDFLNIYDGDDTTAPLLGQYTGTNTPPLLTSSAASGCLTIEFTSDGSVNRPGWVANILCGPPPTCFAPTNLVVTNITQDSAEFSWDDNNTPPPANGWEIVIVPQGQDPATGTTVNVTTIPYTATGLNASTAYDFYVRAICDDAGNDDPSFLTGPLTFQTLVAPPACGGLFVDSGGPSNNYQNDENQTYTICPDNTGDVVSLQFLEFDVEDGWDFLKVYDGDSTAAPLLGEFTGTALPPLLTSSDASGCLTVVFTSDGIINRAGWVANVLCGPPPTCFVIENLVVDNVLNDSVTLSWVDPLNPVPPTDYNIEYGPIGFTQGTGTVVTGLSNPATITGLSAQTSYDFYVQASCDASDQSFWVGPVSVTTLCDVIIAPYTEDFEDGGQLDPCWSQGPNNQENWLFSNDVTAPGHVGNAGDVGGTTTASNGYFAYVDDSFGHNTDTELISPLIDVSGLTTPSLSFYYISNNEGNTNVTFTVDVWDGAAWNTGMFTSNSNTFGWTQVYVNLETLNITGPIKARFIVDENNGSDFYDDLAIDDVTFDEAPSCYNTTNLAVITQTTNSIEITWQDNNTNMPAGGWNVEYGFSGFTQGTGTIINTTSNPLTITGLLSSTNYDFYVQAVCAADGSDSSEWVGPVSGRTDDAPPPNDTCDTAIPLNVTLSCNPTIGNNVLATDSTVNEGEIMPNCADPAANGDLGYEALDVWYTFVVPNTGTVIVETSNAGGMVDTVLAAYTGTCGDLQELDCQDDSVIEPNSDDFRFSSLVLQNLNPGDTIYLRVWSYPAYTSAGNPQQNIQGAFGICVYGQARNWRDSLTVDDTSLNDINISCYPNPVTDVLTINANKPVKSVKVFNMLGQLVKTVNMDTDLNEVDININNLSSGTYFIKVATYAQQKSFTIIKK